MTSVFNSLKLAYLNRCCLISVKPEKHSNHVTRVSADEYLTYSEYESSSECEYDSDNIPSPFDKANAASSPLLPGLDFQSQYI